MPLFKDTFAYLLWDIGFLLCSDSYLHLYYTKLTPSKGILAFIFRNSFLSFSNDEMQF